MFKKYLTNETYQNLKNDFLLELNNADLNQPSSLRKIDSFITTPFKKSKKNELLAIDMGGTNLRIHYLKKYEQTFVVESSLNNKIPQKYTTGNISALFNYIATQIKKSCKHHAEEQVLSAGFTFSFPTRQTSLNSGKLIQWAKEFDLETGFDPVAELTKSLHAIDVNNVEISCLLNDTISTLCAGIEKFCHADVGVICGTGTNMCLKINNRLYNLESGHFNMNLPELHADKIIDLSSSEPGKQRFEKMVSGFYLGKIATQLISESLNLKGFLLTSKKIGEFQLLALKDIQNYFSQNCDIKLNENEATKIKDICIFVTQRSAYMLAATIVGAIEFIDPQLKKKHWLIIDGSVYHKHPNYKRFLYDGIGIINKECQKNVSINYIEQASLMGVCAIL